MAAKIIQFPKQLIAYMQPDYVDAFINDQYRMFADEEDEYFMNQDQSGQRNRQTCFAHRFVRKIVSIFQ